MLFRSLDKQKTNTTDRRQCCLSCSVDGCGWWTSLISDVSLLYLIFCRDLDP